MNSEKMHKGPAQETLGRTANEQSIYGENAQLR